MGQFFSRAGTDTYYANYEKAFERLEKDSAKILDRRVKRRKRMDTVSNVGFWATALAICLAVLLTAYLQQVGTQQWYKKSVTILASFAVPLVLALLSRGVLWLMRLGETRDERFLRKLMDAKRKMIKDLKDSTRFEKTMALIKKYDPDEQPAGSPRLAGNAASGGLRRRPSVTSNGAGAPGPNGTSRTPSIAPTPRAGTGTPGGMLMRPAAAAASAAVSVAAGTGKALMPVFETLATNLVGAGDNPVLLHEAAALRDENSVLKARLAEIEAKLGLQAGGEGAEQAVAAGGADGTPPHKARVASSG
ncbi:hypothetical protein HYH02_000936 [Chlamydomonas schloesseri]|uniref:Uncharacterized protein n=1 Tax=Chlamydomonas schloesseri TaxID=2026947 RepID=A0A835WYY7_9CHLO|nr:hypothetical protein HYH02_000936 [Chlamydomonas schloesseri]|eukprot:KAG2455116.1 hypothetical protein HYH02_000936 [Chlamydomonas schloesseri]